MGASVVLHSSNGLATHHGKTMEWELASLGGAHSPGLGTFSAVPSGGLLLLEFPPSLSAVVTGAVLLWPPVHGDSWTTSASCPPAVGGVGETAQHSSLNPWKCGGC